MGCCLLGCLMAAGPRVAFVLWWFMQPQRVYMTFWNSWIWPIVGVLFLPWTTLMYMIVAPGGLSVINWAFLILALIVDIGTWGGGGEAGRRQYAS